MGDTEVIQAAKPSLPVTQADQYFQMVNIAMSSGNIDQLERMMQMKRDFEADEARKSFNAAMSKFRGICPSIEKDSVVDFTSKTGVRTYYEHETLNGIMLTISEALSDCGLNPGYTSGTNSKNEIEVTCTVTHKDGHSISTKLACAPDESGGKNAVQAIGSIVTYLQRYTLKMALGLSAGHDNDARNEPEVSFIDEQQIKDLEVLINKASKTTEQCLKHWSGQAKIELSSLSEVPDSIYESCTKQLERAISKNQETQS